MRRDIAAHDASKSLAGWFFFDRGLIDGLGLLHEAGNLGEEELRSMLARHPFHAQAVVLPPWREIYVTDQERDQSFEDCLRIHDSLLRWYRRCGVTLHEVPRAPVEQRVDFILSTLAKGGGRHLAAPA